LTAQLSSFWMLKLSTFCWNKYQMCEGTTIKLLTTQLSFFWIQMYQPFVGINIKLSRAQISTVWHHNSYTFECRRCQRFVGTNIKRVRTQLSASWRHTFHLNPKSSIPETLLVPLPKKITAFYGTWMFKIQFTTARHLSLSEARQIRSPSVHHIFVESVFTLTSSPLLGHPRDIYHFGTKTKIL
jgi:hypothetical protein